MISRGHSLRSAIAWRSCRFGPPAQVAQGGQNVPPPRPGVRCLHRPGRVTDRRSAGGRQSIGSPQPARGGAVSGPRAAKLLRKLAQSANLADATEARTLVGGAAAGLRRAGLAHSRWNSLLGAINCVRGRNLRPGCGLWCRTSEQIRLTPPALETLAVVAYRQPVLRADVEAIRGVACGEILRQLMDRDLLRIVGRSEELGAPLWYGTTRRFLRSVWIEQLGRTCRWPAQLRRLAESESASLSQHRRNCSRTMPSVLTRPRIGYPNEGCVGSVLVSHWRCPR